MKKMVIVVIVLFFILFMYLKSTAFNLVQQTSENNPAPDFTLLDLKERSFSLSNLKDKGVILFFWATWCPHCLRAINELNTEYSNMREAGIELLAIDINESKIRVDSFVKKYTIDYPVLLDEDGSVAEKYEVRGVPTIILIKEGKIVEVSHALPDNYRDLLSKR